MKNYKLAIFDLGNVVFNISWEPMFQEWSARSGVKIETLKKRFQFNSAYEQFEIGKITPIEYYNSICETLQISFSYEDFKVGWNNIYCEVREDIKTLIYEFKKNSKVVAFTNTNTVHEEVWPSMYQDILQDFDKVYSSWRIGHRKPTPEGFNKILNDYDLKPFEVIFFDDFEPNIKGAEELGIRSILVTKEPLIFVA